MIRDMLVLLAASDVRSFALNYSVSIAKTFDASLAGVAVIQYPVISGLLSEDVAIFDSYDHDIEMRARSAMRVFEEKRRQEKFACGGFLLAGGKSAPRNFSELLRDVTISPSSNKRILKASSMGAR